MGRVPAEVIESWIFPALPSDEPGGPGAELAPTMLRALRPLARIGPQHEIPAPMASADERRQLRELRKANSLRGHARSR